MLPLFFSVIASLAIAQASDAVLRPELIERALGQLRKVNESIPAECIDEVQLRAALPACAEVTDNFCASHWSPANRGVSQVFDGKILQGLSPLSGSQNAYLLDLKIFSESADRLPPDLAEPLRPILEKLKAHLENEQSGKAWSRGLADLRRQIDQVYDDVAAARLEHAHPGIGKINPAKYSADQIVKTKAADNQVRDDVLKAKYANHPNWRRVERVFSEAQADLLAEIETMNLAPEKKKVMLERARAVKLTLPLMDVNAIAAEEDCGTSQSNAFYKRTYNKITVCAGFFNRFQSDSVLYGTILHEIGHSVDPQGLASYRCVHESPVVKALAPLDGASGAPYGCAEWEKAKAIILNPPPTPGAKPWPELDQLYGCLQSRENLDELTPERLASAAQQAARAEMAGYAGDNDFLSLVVPSYIEYGATIKNEGYMRPDVWFAKNYKYKRPEGTLSEPTAVDILNQELACGNEGKPFAAASEQEGAKIFSNALSETRSLLAARTLDTYQYCGKNCTALAPQGLGVSAGENFADWIAFKSLKRRLNRIGDLDHRREASALFSADLCSAPGLYANVPELSEAERSHSRAVHPDNSLRRLSVYNKENAALAGCRLEDGGKGFAACDIK